MLQASGLKTVLSASDETATKASLTDLQVYGDATRLLGQWNVHTYKATDEERVALRDEVRRRGLRLWMSESGDGGRGLHGNLRMLQRLFDDMRYLQPVAWVDWQYAEEFTDQWNLVRTSWSAQTFERIPNFYVRQHVTRFIRQGYTFLDVDDRQTLCALSPDGRQLVIVRLNATREPSTAEYLLSAFPNAKHEVKRYVTTRRAMLSPDVMQYRGDTLRVDLPPLSVATYLIQTQ